MLYINFCLLRRHLWRPKGFNKHFEKFNITLRTKSFDERKDYYKSGALELELSPGSGDKVDPDIVIESWGTI